MHCYIEPVKFEIVKFRRTNGGTDQVTKNGTPMNGVASWQLPCSAPEAIRHFSHRDAFASVRQPAIAPYRGSNSQPHGYRSLSTWYPSQPTAESGAHQSQTQ